MGERAGCWRGSSGEQLVEAGGGEDTRQPAIASGGVHTANTLDLTGGQVAEAMAEEHAQHLFADLLAAFFAALFATLPAAFFASLSAAFFATLLCDGHPDSSSLAERSEAP